MRGNQNSAEGVESSAGSNGTGPGDPGTSTESQSLLQIPAAVEKLRQQLESIASPVSLNRQDLQTDGFGSIFGGGGNPRVDDFLSNTDVKTIRLLLMRVIGQCQTLTELDFSDDDPNFLLRLDLEELKELLGPLERSPVLRRLNLDGQRMLSTKDGARVVGAFVEKNRSCQVLSTRIPLPEERPGPKELSVSDIGYNGHFNPELMIQIMINELKPPQSQDVKPLRYWHGFAPQISVQSVVKILRSCQNLRAIHCEPERVSQWRCSDAFTSREKSVMGMSSSDVWAVHPSLDSVSLIGRSWESGLGSVVEGLASNKIRKSLKTLRIYCTYFDIKGNSKSWTEGPHGNVHYEDEDPGMFKEEYYGSTEPDLIQGDSVSSAIRSSTELDSLGLYRLRFSPEEWQKIFQALRHTLHLSKLGCSCDLKAGFDESCWKGLTKVVKFSSTLKFLKLESFPGRECRVNPGIRGLMNVLKSNHVVETLVLSHFHMEAGEVLALSACLEARSSLKELSLVSCHVVRIWTLFQSLRKNRILRKLDLSGTDGLTDKAYIELSAMLRVNSSLREIDITATNWEREGRRPMLQEALAQRGRQEDYVHVMEKYLGSEEFKSPNSGRLFLCGEPSAGKTQLRKSMVKLAARRNSNSFRMSIYSHLGLRGHTDSAGIRLRRRLRSGEDPIDRTDGIEIEPYVIDGMYISIWDLAGQEIFRALHDCLFPTFNTACVFLFVFSPYHKPSNSLKRPLNQTLKREIVPWLEFIASNSRLMVGRVLPEVMILVSHKDKLTKIEDLDLGWANQVAKEMRGQFSGLLSVDVQVLNADSTYLLCGVDTVFERVQKSFRELLNDSVRQVPQTCVEIANFLHGRRLKLGDALQEVPVVDVEAFFSLCLQDNASPMQAYRNEPEIREPLMDAISKFLHDTGTIIRLPESKLIVVDPNWYTCSFLGRLIGRGHDEEIRVPMRSDGLITEADFKSLLRELTLVGKSTVTRETSASTKTKHFLQRLQNVMEEMDLCFQVGINDQNENRIGIFAPMLFAESEGNPRGSRATGPGLPNWSLQGMGEVSYVGLRLQRKDPERTRLTPSFFPRLQVYFRNFLKSIYSRVEDLLVCKYNLMTLTIDGHEIHVENDRVLSGNHIDVLARSYKTHNHAMRYLMQNVVEVIQTFCTSPKGCPGVTLTVSVMRSDCVRDLTPSKDRKDKVAVLIADLVTEWKEDIIRKAWGSGEYTAGPDDAGTEYMYTWPEVDSNIGLPRMTERARELLMDQHFSEVVQSVGDALGRHQKRLTVVEEEVTKHLQDSSSSSMNQAPTEASGLGLGSPRVAKYDRRSWSDLSDVRSGQKLEHTIWRVGNKLDEVGHEVEEVKMMVMELQADVKMIGAFQISYQRSLSSLNTTLDRLIGCPSKPKIPKRPYFTTETTGMRHWITAKIGIRRPLTLHFMCERRNHPHFVEGQEGFPLTVDKENMEFLRFLSVNFVKVLIFLVKAGISIPLGHNVAVQTPSIDIFLPGPGEYMKLNEETADQLLQKLEKGKSRIEVVEKSWAYLQQLFVRHLKDKCPELFKLYRCRYSPNVISRSESSDSAYAWLCNECLQNGRGNGSVDRCG